MLATTPSPITPAQLVSENPSNRNTLPKNVSVVKTPGSYNLNNSSDSESEDDIPMAKPKGTILLKYKYESKIWHYNFRSPQNTYD